MSKTLVQRLADLNIEVGTAMTIDWQQVRIQAAIAAMQGAISIVGSREHIARMCVELADALIEELKKGGNNENN